MALLGYARVSTLHQSPEMQIAALREAGAERIWIDQMSGTRDDRPELASLLDYVRRGDVLMVWRLDRLGRSLPHLLAVATDLHDRGVELRSLTESVDTTTAGDLSSGSACFVERVGGGDGVGAQTGAAGVAAGGTGGGYPCRGAFGCDGSFELCDSAEDVKDQPPARSGGVHRFGEGTQFDAAVVQVRGDGEQVG